MNSCYLQITNLIQMKCNSKGNLISSNLSSGNCSYLESASFMIFFSCSFLILIWTYSLQTEQTSHFSVLGWFVPLGPPGKGECAKWWGIPGQSYLAIAITEKNHPNYLPNYKTTVFGIPSTGLVLLFIHVFIYSFDSLMKHKFINLYISWEYIWQAPFWVLRIQMQWNYIMKLILCFLVCISQHGTLPS